MLTVIIGQNLLSSVFIFTYRVKILWSFHHGFTLTSSHLSVCFHHTSQKTTVCPLKFMDFTTNAASNSPELNNLIWQPELNCWCIFFCTSLRAPPDRHGQGIRGPCTINPLPQSQCFLVVDSLSATNDSHMTVTVTPTAPYTRDHWNILVYIIP